MIHGEDAQDSKKVKVLVTDSCTLISPWPKVLERKLQCRRRKQGLVGRTDPKTGNVVKRMVTTYVSEPLWYMPMDQPLVGPKVGVVWFGITNKAVNIMKKAGMEVVLEDNQTPVAPADFSRLNLAKMRTGQAECLALLSSERHCIIEAPTGWGKTKMIEQMVRIYPKARFLVMTRRSSVRDDLYRRIAAADPHRKIQKVVSGQALDASMTVLVMSDKSVHRMSELPDDWTDILIYDEAHNAGCEDICTRLDRFQSCRTYGFSASPTGRSDGTDDQTLAVLGPIRLRIPYQAAEEAGDIAGIDFVLYEIPGKTWGLKSPQSKTRLRIVKNEERNALVAWVCRCEVPKGEQLLIMVEQTEHVFRLRKYLPGAVLIYRAIKGDRFAEFQKAGLLNATDRQKVPVEQYQKDFREGRIRLAITTMVWQEG